MRKAIFKCLVFIITLCKFLFPQAISFYPNIDTLFIGGGCTSAVIYAELFLLDSVCDSISVRPGFNTYIWAKDSLNKTLDFQNVYYIINDTSSQKNYQLWVVDNWIDGELKPQQVPFDSNFTIENSMFFHLKLLLQKSDTIIDSVSQLFIPVIGIGIEEDLKRSSLVHPRIVLNYPNPFNSSTLIKYQIPKYMKIQISIFDVLGKEIELLFNDFHDVGIYEFEWNANQFSSGVYLLSISSENYRSVQKCLLIK